MTLLLGPSVLDPSLYISDLKTRRKAAALAELVTRAHEAGVVRNPHVLRDTLLLRERVVPSAIGKGVAVPHARSIGVVDARIVVARSKRGVDWDVEGDPVQLVLLVLSPAESSEDAHAERVARAASVARLQRHRQRLLEASAFEGIAQVFEDA
jgi:mannitol/fructose-specific phosphotransferase system IIA component (Ntr-type)